MNEKIEGKIIKRVQSDIARRDQHIREFQEVTQVLARGFEHLAGPVVVGFILPAFSARLHQQPIIPEADQDSNHKDVPTDQPTLLASEEPQQLFA